MSDPTSNTAASPVIMSANKVKELTNLIREASAILNEIPEASAPKNMRFPLMDELDGYSHMLAQAANIEPLQGPEIEGIRAFKETPHIDSEKLQGDTSTPQEPLAKVPGMAVHALAGEIVEALLADDKDGGYDLTAGMFGPNFSALVRRWAAAEFYSPQADRQAQVKQAALSTNLVSRVIDGGVAHPEKASDTAVQGMAKANAVLQDLWVYKDLAWVYEGKLHICQGSEHADRMRSIGAEVFDMRDAHKMNLSDSVIDQVCRQVFDGESDPAQRENWIASFKLMAEAHAKQAAEQAIAYLRRNSDEPFSIELCDGIDVEVRPITEDQRITVGCEGQGYTIVNYTSEGLIVDVYSADQSSLEPCASMALDRADLDDPNLEEVNQSDMFRPTGG